MPIRRQLLKNIPKYPGGAEMRPKIHNAVVYRTGNHFVPRVFLLSDARTLAMSFF